MKNSLIVSFLVVLAACAQKQEPTQNQPVEKITVVEVDSVPGKNEYVVTEDVFWLLPEEQENHFIKAKELYGKKELKAASSEVKKASFYLEQEIGKAEGKGKETLISAKNKLENLSGRLEKGAKVSEAELVNSFYETNIALCRNYIMQQTVLAEGYKDEKNKIGANLDIALKRVENAERWSGKKLDSESSKIVEEGKIFSQKIKNDFDKDKAALAKEWNIFIKKLKKLDEKLEGTALD